MYDIKTALIVTALLLAATGFCIYQVNSEKKVGHYCEIKKESPCEEEYRKFCWNGGKGFYLFDENLVACNSTWLYGGKRCEEYLWWT